MVKARPAATAGLAVEKFVSGLVIRRMYHMARASIMMFKILLPENVVDLCLRLRATRQNTKAPKISLKTA